MGSEPRVVCLCGSTRFLDAFDRAGLAETLAGRVVLSIGSTHVGDDEALAGCQVPGLMEASNSR